jgi:hypothetical protein
VSKSSPSQRPKLEPVRVDRYPDGADRQNLADTAMAGQTTRDPAERRYPRSHPPLPLDHGQLTPNPAQDHWFVRTGQIAGRRTQFDSEDPPPAYAWAHGRGPYVLAVAASGLALVIVAFLVFG